MGSGSYNSMLKVMRKYLGSYIATESSEPEHISVIEEAVRLSKLDAYWVDVKAEGIWIAAIIALTA